LVLVLVVVVVVEWGAPWACSTHLVVELDCAGRIQYLHGHMHGCRNDNMSAACDGELRSVRQRATRSDISATFCTLSCNTGQKQVEGVRFTHAAQKGCAS
jgi:hypothetical protein